MIPPLSPVNRESRPSRPCRATPGLLAAVLVTTGSFLPLTGCYHRVISARGIGAETVETKKPYRSETALDRAVFPDSRTRE